MAIPTDKPRVIVIDDSKLMRVSIRNVLKDEFQLVEAIDGEQGWSMLCADPTLQVVITDAQMPGIDGYELITRIRASENATIRSVPIIMITGAGATDFIIKPFDRTQLLARTRALAKSDQTSRKLAQTSEALAEQGAVDSLTGINSRRFFVERGAQELAFCTRRNQDLSVIMVRIDQFADAQKQHGQEHADQLLQWVAKKLKDTVRTEDTLARIDGAAFAIIAAGAGRLEAAVLCDRMRKALNAAPFSDGPLSTAITASVGLVCLSFDKLDTIEKLLALAGQRALRARSEGGNRTVASNPQQKTIPAPEEPAPGIEAALQMVAARNFERLQPHLIGIMKRLLPLFEAADQRLQLGLSDALATI
ncbi:MAG: diguanylate cyclase, partial [Gammaproteobacteria bacterium]|nr:diguanylate cyclase [Gammaproteobacteria bacterium]